MTEHDPLGLIIFWVTLIFSFALVGRYCAQRMNQSGVLGELLAGIVIGNIFYFWGLPLFVILREGAFVFKIIHQVLEGSSLSTAIHGLIHNPEYAEQMLTILKNPLSLEWIKVAYVLDIFSRYGVIFLLFMVGLESSVSELKKSGRAASQVAIIGVIAPMFLGWAVAYCLIPNVSFQTALFIGATLSATSIGITARVLSEMKKLNTREARTILGAALLDDVLGLILLAVVSSIVIKGVFDPLLLIRVVLSALLFFACVLALGPRLLRVTIRCFAVFELREAQLFVAFLVVMLFAWLATLVGLASIIGAFSAGLILHDGFFDGVGHTRRRFQIKELIWPFEAIFAPLFFILIGIQVKLESFLHVPVLLMAGGLMIAAILGKLLSGLGADKQDDRWLIGIGMLPRGEVGLVFASIGRTLGVISDDLFAAMICMVVVTTLMTPPLLTKRYSKQ